METSDLLKKVRKIEIKTRGLSNQIFSGEYHSAFKGRGMSFSEVRDYAYGDDVRNIDWNVTARFNQPFVKVFEEERELTAILMIDVSKSAYFGSTELHKNEFITELSAVLSFSAINNNDKVGVIFFSDKIELFIPPKKGKSHILRIIRELIEIKPTNTKTDLNLALKYLTSVLKKRAIVFFMSDFMDLGYSHSLNIASRKHDIVGLKINDPRDSELPDMGITQIMDSESGQMLTIDTSSKKVRERYQQNYLESDSYFERAFAKSGTDKIRIPTNESYIKHLMRFFKKRGTKR